MINNRQGTFAPIALITAALMQTACSTLQAPTLPQPFDDDYAPIINYLSRLIPQEMKDSNLEGLSIALVNDQSVIWSEGFGTADKERAIPATHQTRYRAGSVSKVFNAYAVMQLEEQGLLDLDSPVASYVSGFSINSRFGSTDNISLRTLISHQSGLPSDMVDGMWSENPLPLNSLLPALRDAYVIAPANSVFNYSNTGVSLSGLAVQTLSEKAYEQYMQEAILQPIGMDDSDFTGHLQGDKAAAGYVDGKLIDELPLRDTPAGGLNTTVEDLAKFLKVVNAEGKPLINESSFNQMQQVQNEGRQLDLGQRVGLGWIIGSKPLGDGYTVLWHSGGTIAHSTLLSTAPELDIGVVVMSNSADSNNALQRIVNEAMQQLYLTKGLPTAKNKKSSGDDLNLNTSTELAGEYAGIFGLLDITPDGDRFSASALGTRFSLRPEQGDWFSPRIMLWFIPLRPKELKPLRVTQATIDGQSRLIGQYDNEHFLLGDLIDPYPASDQWDQHLGQYEIQNPVEVSRMKIEDMHFKRAEHYYYLEVTEPDNDVIKMPVRPLNDQQLLILGTGRGMGGTVSFTGEPGESEFAFSGLIYRRTDASL